jgi:hypothetical protein
MGVSDFQQSPSRHFALGFGVRQLNYTQLILTSTPSLLRSTRDGSLRMTSQERLTSLLLPEVQKHVELI